MEMTRNLPMYEELVPGAPGLGHLPRKMAPADTTDGGIIDRIKMAAGQGLISMEAASYLMENLLQDDAVTANALRRMPGPQTMPPISNTFPHGLKRGLLE